MDRKTRIARRSHTASPRSISLAELLEARRMLAEISSLDLEGASFDGSVLVDNGYRYPHTGEGRSYIVAGPARSGSNSLRMYLGANTSMKQREEYYISQSAWQPGQTRWMGMSMQVPAGMPAGDSFFIVSQLLFQSQESSPPIHMTVENINGQLHYILKNLGPNNVSRGRWTTPANPGQWKDFVFHIKASAGSDGFLKAWVNGQVWADYTGPTIKNGSKQSTTRIGIYKGPDDSTHNMYYDEIRVHDANSSYSQVAPGGGQQPPPPQPSAPAAPSGLIASAASSSQINLSWTDNSNNEQSFEIQYKKSSTTTWLALATTGANVESRSASGLDAGTSYDFRIRAVNTDGSSAWSNTATATTQTNPTPPPTNEPGPNIATSGTISAFSSQQTGNEAAKAIDGITGDDTNRWSANGYPQWIEVDLGSEQILTGTGLDTFENRAYRFKVEARTASGTYATIVDRTTNSAAGPITDVLATSVMARFVRLTVTGASGYTGTWASIREFKIFGDDETNPPPPSGDDNLALNKPVTASASDGNVPANAVDGIDNTDDNRWSANGYPQWLEVDLGSDSTIGGTEVVSVAGRAYKFKVEARTASGAWETVVDRTASTTASPIADTFTPVTARYVRLTVTGASGYTGSWVSIREFKVFGDGGTTTPPPPSGTTALAAMDDSFVRGGSYASENYGGLAALTVKNDSNDAYDRQAYMKFDVSPFSSAVSSARLKFKVTGTDADTATTNYQVLLVSNDTWTEDGLTWNNKPATSTLLGTLSGITLGQVVDLDVTSAVNGQLADGKFSLAIIQVETGSKRILGIGSKESATAADHPTLVITP
jgi:hypothetical protein